MSKLRAPQIDTGDGADQIVGLNGSSQLPAVDGSQLTSVDSITLNGASAGTGANNLVQLNGSSQLPAVDGSLVTSLNASNVASGTLNTARLDTSGVAAGSYTNTDLTVDDKGRITAAASGSSGATYRGALVNTGGVNISIGSLFTTIAFAQEQYDTDSIHDTVTDNSHLTVPAGVSQVRLFWQLHFNTAASPGDVEIQLTRNGSATFPGGGGASQQIPTSYNSKINGTTGKIDVTPGDYFEVTARQNTGGVFSTAADAGQRCWFEMEIIT